MLSAKNESNNCFIILLKKISTNTHCRAEQSLKVLFEVMHCARNLQVSKLTATRKQTNPYVALISKINFANEKTDSEYNV